MNWSYQILELKNQSYWFFLPLFFKNCSERIIKKISFIKMVGVLISGSIKCDDDRWKELINFNFDLKISSLIFLFYIKVLNIKILLSFLPRARYLILSTRILLLRSLIFPQLALSSKLFKTHNDWLKLWLFFDIAIITNK